MHELYDVVDVRIVAPYTLWVKFDDNTEQTIDFRPVLHGELYSPLQDLALFNQVRIDQETKILVWPNGADFDPETLHNWQEYLPIFQKQATQWNKMHISHL
jgi:hypothetical protein